MFKLSNETKIGILFIVGIALAVWGFKFLKGINLLSSNKQFYVEYSNVDGLLPSSPVFVNGLQVGTVKDIYLKDEDDKTVIAELNIQGRVDVPKNAEAHITALSLMGGKAINLVIPQPCEGDDCAEDGDFLIGKSKTFLESIIGSPDELDAYTDKLKYALTTVYDSISDPNDPKGLGRSLVAMQEAVVNMSVMTTKINRLLDAMTGNLVATAKNAETITRTLADNQANLTASLQNVKTLTEQLTQAHFENQAQKAGVALDSMTASLSELRVTLQDMQKTVGVTTNLVQKLNHGDGTAGKLLTDEDLYANLTNSIAHLELLLQDLRLNPKRYNTVKLKLFGNKRPNYQNPDTDPAYELYRDSSKLIKQ